MSDIFDLVVIGGGSGGLAAAQRAAEYGVRVALVESGRLGGTCVNVGCVPKKITWNAADLGGALHDAVDYGFQLQVAGHDWALLKQRRDAYILRLNELYAANLARHQVELVRARASFVDAGTVSAAGRRLSAAHIIIATGGRPRRPLIPGTELGITSDGFFELSQRPQRVAVVGSSYIALELAGIFAGLGADTTLVLRGDTALKTFDDMLGEATLSMLREEGVDIVLHASPAALARGADGALELRARDGRRLGPFDCVLWAVGRVAAVEDLALGRAGVALDIQGFIATDLYQASSAERIYAVGDVAGRAQLTPVAIAAGRRLADRLFGGQSDRRLDYENIHRSRAAHRRPARRGSGRGRDAAGVRGRGAHGGDQEGLRRHGGDSSDFCGRIRHHALNTQALPLRSLSAASTGAVSGRRPRHRRNDSAACSTSMPQPCSARAHPCRLAHSTKAVADLP